MYFQLKQCTLPYLIKYSAAVLLRSHERLQIAMKETASDVNVLTCYLRVSKFFELSRKKRNLEKKFDHSKYNFSL